jgi:hypothetical protein
MARTGEKRNFYRILVGKLEGTRSLGGIPSLAKELLTQKWA